MSISILLCAKRDLCCFLVYRDRVRVEVKFSWSKSIRYVSQMMSISILHRTKWSKSQNNFGPLCSLILCPCLFLPYSETTAATATH